MGRIKTSFVKHVAKDLLEKYPDKFSTNYEKNKNDLKEVMIFESKRMRNTVAGYLSVIKRQQKG
jgi:small subunit ribosomal protein S17e